MVERAHLHVLKTRVENFAPPMLEQLSQQRTIFEYWSHAAAFLPTADYRYYLPVMHGFARHRDINKKLQGQVLARIAAEGPLQAKDFSDPRAGKASGWWDWKPSKQVLESLFLGGELMIARRHGFQKVYDLTERVLGSDVDTRLPSARERGEFYVRRMLAAHGLATARDIAYPRASVLHLSRDNIQPLITTALRDMADAGELCQLDVAGDTYFALAAALAALPSRVAKPQMRVLSPFDNLVINRPRLRALFDFDYQLECYVPEKKRRYGYFCLPLLLGDTFIGRMDCKVYRDTARLEIKNLWLESGVRIDDRLIHALVCGLQHYATAVACTHIDLLHTDDVKLQPALLAQLKAGSTNSYG